jgi:hypothetical protein
VCANLAIGALATIRSTTRLLYVHNLYDSCVATSVLAHHRTCETVYEPIAVVCVLFHRVGYGDAAGDHWTFSVGRRIQNGYKLFGYFGAYPWATNRSGNKSFRQQIVQATKRSGNTSFRRFPLRNPPFIGASCAIIFDLWIVMHIYQCIYDVCNKSCRHSSHCPHPAIIHSGKRWQLIVQADCLIVSIR